MSWFCVFLSLVVAPHLVRTLLHHEAGKALLIKPSSEKVLHQNETRTNNTVVKSQKLENKTRTNNTVEHSNKTRVNNTIENSKTRVNNTMMAYRHPILQYATSVVVQASLGQQTLGLIPDTGSFDVLVSSVLCEKCKSKKYRVTESSSFKLASPMKQTTFHFGPGDVTALQAYDRFEAGPFTISKMPVWLISQISPSLYPSFQSTEFDGLMGLGLSRSAVAEEMGVKSYTLCLQTFVSSWWSSGFLHWNGRDDHSFQWGPSIRSWDTFHWQVRASQIEFGDTWICSGCTAVLDSGTSILAVPTYEALRLEKNLPEVPANCSLEGLPSLKMQLTGGQSLTLPPAAYVMKLHGDTEVFDGLEKDGAIVWRRPKSNTTGSQQCAPMFQITKSGHWILGMPFFREYAAHFDRRKKSMSFAKNKGGKCGPGSSFSAHHAPQAYASGVVEVESSDLAKALERRL